MPSPSPDELPAPRWALVTGGGVRGGAAIARSLHARGLNLILHHRDRSAEEAGRLAAELEAARPASTRLWQAELSQQSISLPPELAALPVTVLVCNASRYRKAELEDATAFAIDHAIHVGAHRAIIAALRPGLESIIGISDIGIDRAPPGYLSYTVAKAALEAMILALAVELAPQTRCNVVRPGSLPYPEDWHDYYRAQQISESIPLRRLGSFDELAQAVAFLALDAHYVTGQVLAVDGGRSRFSW